MRSGDNRMRFRLSTDVAESAGSNSSTHFTVGEWVDVTYVKRGGSGTVVYSAMPPGYRNPMAARSTHRFVHPCSQ